MALEEVPKLCCNSSSILSQVHNKLSSLVVKIIKCNNLTATLIKVVMEEMLRQVFLITNRATIHHMVLVRTNNNNTKFIMLIHHTQTIIHHSLLNSTP